MNYYSNLKHMNMPIAIAAHVLNVAYFFYLFDEACHIKKNTFFAHMEKYFL